MENFIDFGEETPGQHVHRLENKIRRLEIEKEALHAKLEAERKDFLNTIYNQSQEIDSLSHRTIILERSTEALESIFRKLRIELPKTEEPNHGLD
jgi:hypothetical protein